MPNFGEAHCGEGAPQSQQRSLEDDFWISRSYGGQFGTGMKRSWIGIGGDKKSKTAKLQNYKTDLHTFDLVSGSISHIALLAMAYI